MLWIFPTVFTYQFENGWINNKEHTPTMINTIPTFLAAGVGTEYSSLSMGCLVA